MDTLLRHVMGLFIALAFVLQAVAAVPTSAFSQSYDRGVAVIGDQSYSYTESYYRQPTALEWEFQQGDWIVANVDQNTLQFVRADNSELSQPVEMGSGINDGNKMWYLGLYYDPKTPEQTWEIRSTTQQTWWNVFGSKEAKEQLFLRLYKVKANGERVYTRYGIHTTPEVETIFTEKDGFGSWGCLLTRYDLLKRIEELYHLNDEVLKVVTTSQDTQTVLSQSQAS